MDKNDRIALIDYVSGSEDAFKLLVDKYSPAVYAAAKRKLGNSADAEDASQAVFIILSRKAGHVAKHRNLPGWLLKVTGYVAIDMLRKRERAEKAVMAKTRKVHKPENSPDDEPGWLDELIARLPRKQREAIELHFVGKKTYEEIADLLACGKSTIQMRIKLGLEKLQAQFRAGGAKLAPSVLAGMGQSAVTAEAATAISQKIFAGVMRSAKGQITGPPGTIAKEAAKLMLIAKAKAVAAIAAAIIATAGCGWVAVQELISMGSFHAVIVEAGKPMAVIVIPENPIRISYSKIDKTKKPWEPVYFDTRYAAEELQRFIEQSTGARLPIESAVGDCETGVRIFVGQSPVTKKFGIAAPEDPEGFSIREKDGHVFILGEIAPAGTNNVAEAIDRGTLHGVYAFLEQAVGFRFYFYDPVDPELGFVIPKTDTLKIAKNFFLSAAPDFRHRTGGALTPAPDEGGWLPVTRQGSSTGFIANHTDEQWGLCFAKDHPEWFFSRNDGQKNDRHLDYTIPEILEKRLEIADAWMKNKSWQGGWVKPNEKYIPFVPTDLWSPNARRSSAMMSKAQKDLPYGGFSDIIFRHGADFADEVKTRWPGMRVSMLAYEDYMQPPTFDLPDNLDVMVCLMLSCAIGKEDYIHEHNLKLIREWSRKVDGDRERLFIWAYPCWPACSTNVPLIYPYYQQRWLRAIHPYVSGEFLNSSMRNVPVGHFMNYIWFRLMWDRNLDIAATLDDYCENFYGPAAGAMKEFYTLFIDRYENTKWSVKCRTWYVRDEMWYLESFPHEVIVKLKEFIDAAVKSFPDADGGIYKKRTLWMADGLKPFFEEAGLSQKWLSTELRYAVGHCPITGDDWQLSEMFEKAPKLELVKGQYGKPADIGTTVAIVQHAADIHIRIVADKPGMSRKTERIELTWYLRGRSRSEKDTRNFTITTIGDTGGNLNAVVGKNELKDGQWTVELTLTADAIKMDHRQGREAGLQVTRCGIAGNKKEDDEYVLFPQLGPEWGNDIRAARIVFKATDGKK